MEFMCEHDTGPSRPKCLSNTHGSHKPGFVSHRPLIHCMTMVTGKLYEQAIEAPWHVSCFLTSDFIYMGGVFHHSCYRKKTYLTQVYWCFVWI